MTILIFLNGTNHSIILKFLIMLDLVADTYLITSIYPLITLIKKDDTLYSLKGIITNSFYDLGIFFSSFFLGKILFNYHISYNTLLLLALILVIVSFVILLKLKIEPSTLREQDEPKEHNGILKYLKNDQISKLYFLYVLLVNTSFYAVTGLKMLILTEIAQVSPQISSNWLLIVGIISDIVSILVLKYFTSQKYYVNVFVKFGGRLIIYFLAFLTNNISLFILSIFYTMLFSESYNNVTDAPYINRVNNNLQFCFNNIKGMVSYLAQAIGIWICGFAFIIGIQYMFLISTALLIIQLFLMTKLHQQLDKTIP